MTHRNDSPFRDDNSHEDIKRDELHVEPDADPDIITVSGMIELWERFCGEIPKFGFDID